MSKKLEGKVAVVTGGTSGIGLAAARRLAEEGAHVFITGRRQSELDAAVRAVGHDVTGVRGDVSKPEDLDRLYDAVRDEKGRIDVLFANAGVAEFAPLGAVTEEHYDRLFDINVKGLLFSVQKALPLFSDGGSIILNASVAASKGIEAFGVYSATKAAVRSFARSWTTDLKGRRIRVNTISPGPIDTPIMDGLAGSPDAAEEIRAHLASGVPLGRIGSPDEIAGAVAFLASDDSTFITGIELSVDGGLGQV
jgi:NAD(P)-dependent dehydrogenase (short-subunit alcohol dehydrogenase family)